MINEIKESRWPSSVICFGGEDWWYHNRGHCDMQFMRQFAQHGRVLYVNSIVMRKPNISEGAMFWRRLRRKARSIARGLVRVGENFWVYSPVTAPVHHLSWARPMNDRFLRAQVRLAARRIGLRDPLVWVNCPAACDTALALRRTALVYQRTDRYEEYPGVDIAQMTRFDQLLKGVADLTFFSNRMLCEEERRGCRNAVHLDHGVDYDLFANADRDSQVPPELRELRHPVAGFFGGIDSHTFDMDLMAGVVQLLPDVTFAFVGNTSIDCAALTRYRNVVMVGQQPYEQIAQYGKCFDVCLMPWNQNRWIEACNPIKLKEYLALGKPIVSTPFPELSSVAHLVNVGSTPQAFAMGIQEALKERGQVMVQARREHVAPLGWSAQARKLLANLSRPLIPPSRALCGGLSA